MTQTRMTKQRSIIIELLRHSTAHPTADEIYGIVRKKLPRISLGTVYRNLDYLANTGVIRRIDRAGQQMRFDGNMLPHQHIRCRQCGSLGDIYPPLQVPSTSEVRVQGFDLHETEVEFIGICHTCKAQQATSL